MARIRMAVDDDDKDAQQRLEAASSYTADPAATVTAAQQIDTNDGSEPHWRLGSHGNLVDSRFAMRETSWIDPAVRNTFDADLHRFIRDAFPNELDADGAGKIMVCSAPCRNMCSRWTTDSTVQVYLCSLHVAQRLDRQVRYTPVQPGLPGQQ
jgi:hypothetical protein